MKALEDAHIPAYAPRARGYFENEEIQLIVGCYSIIFGFYGEAIKDLEGSFSGLVEYTQNAIAALGPYSQINPEMAKYLRRKVEGIERLKDGESLDLTVTDYFYHLIAFEPFSRFMKNENRARNLAIFSQLLGTFQDYYNINIVTYKNKEWIPKFLFNSFFKFLLDGGINEYEDPDNPIPSGYVQVMTIHQSKGLEFPVVVVGSLDKEFKVMKRVDKDLMPFYQRPAFEPEDRITEFDRMRLFYVAFSRSEKILALTTANTPNDFLSPVWDGLDQWPYVETKVLESLKFKPKSQFVPKKSYSLTSHINVYEVCPRQYQLYQEYEFTPSRSATMIFGTVVHQTIEEIHKWVIEGKLADINYDKIEDFFEGNYRSLVAIGMRPLSKARKETAFNHVLDYFNGSREELKRVIDTEVDVSVEKDNYILTGKIDLLNGKDGKLEVLDFKTQAKPEKGDPILDRYFKQLCIYAHILKERYGKHPERLYIYWTPEKKRNDALMEFSFTEEDIRNSGTHFDDVVLHIQKKDFAVKNPPNTTKVCKECDFRTYCAKEGTIIFKSKDLNID
jgi:DNA helicase-2/ATP-dependent DNA helicase PcrA